MKKIIITLIIILIGVQSWTLKTQQQILEMVTPEPEEINLSQKFHNETFNEHCSYIFAHALVQTYSAERDHDKYMEERDKGSSISSLSIYIDGQKESFEEAANASIVYDTFCKKPLINSPIDD